MSGSGNKGTATTPVMTPGQMFTIIVTGSLSANPQPMAQPGRAPRNMQPQAAGISVTPTPDTRPMRH